MPHDHLGLFDTPPNRKQIRFSLAIVGLLIVTACLILPVRHIPLPQVDAFIPMIAAVMFLGELITATLLYAQATVFRSRSLTVLATGYVFTALLLIPHALTFPGAFSETGLLGAGINTTAWVTLLRRVGFPIAIILYVVLRRTDAAAQSVTERPAPRIALSVFAATVLAAAVTLVVTRAHDWLPPFFLNRAQPIYSDAVWYEAVAFGLFVVALVALSRSRRSVLDMWLLVALSGWLIQSFLIMTLEARFTAGWYCLYVMMLVSHLVVLLALVAESNRLYLRLALSKAARDREREARLMSMEAVAAAISHEVGQPLSAVITNATGGLNWLARARPNPEMAIKALHATIDAGKRATDVTKSIRAMFAKRPGAPSEFDLNELVRETASLLDRELTVEKVSLRLALDEALPPIQADRIQIQQVLVNLLTNAIDSVRQTQRPYRIAIRSAPLDEHNVLLEVSDSGKGISPEEMAQIFQAFFTTKPTGTGLGLSLSRTIVEEHGGTLWASAGEEHGATFHLRLPRGGLDAI